MFTGLVADRGTVKAARMRGPVFELEITTHLARDLTVGDSIAVNGVCLTATKVGRRSFRTQAMRETLDKTTIGRVQRGRHVNLELALRLADRLGGHLVQGHVDGLARISGISDDGASRRMRFTLPADLGGYVATKGSVCIDGVSLTVASANGNSFEVALIPHTLAVTNLGDKQEGDDVNVEVDLLARYIERLTQSRTNGT